MQTTSSADNCKGVETLRLEFIEKIGLISKGGELTQIAGRVFGLLVWEGVPMAFGDIACQLKISRGSASSATRSLEDRRLIKRVAIHGERQDFFQLSDSPYSGMIERVAARMDAAQKDIFSTAAQMPDSHNETKARIEAYGRFYKSLSKALTGAIQDID